MAMDRQRKIEPRRQLFIGFFDLFVDHLVSNLGDLGLGEVNNQDKNGNNSNKRQSAELEAGSNFLVAGFSDVSDADVSAGPDQASPKGPDYESFVAHGCGSGHHWN